MPKAQAKKADFGGIVDVECTPGGVWTRYTPGAPHRSPEQHRDFWRAVNRMAKDELRRLNEEIREAKGGGS